MEPRLDNICVADQLDIAHNNATHAYEQLTM
jgi:hypothetical protein